MATSIDRSDTRRLLVQATNSGERYVVEECSVWDDDQCVGARVIRASDPIYYGDLADNDDARRRDMLDWHLDNEIEEDDWFNQNGAFIVIVQEVI